MLAQRGSDLTREPQPKRDERKDDIRAASKADVPKRRMTFRDKHALETLPGEIAAMQARAKTLQDTLDDPNFYARDRSGFEEATAALGALQHEIAAAEERWLALEMEREALETEVLNGPEQ
jgi:ABC transport system ATP-binding/permease protein